MIGCPGFSRFPPEALAKMRTAGPAFSVQPFCPSVTIPGVDVPDFQRVLAEGCALQARLSDLSPIAVGGTAAAVHCGHRFSLDVDVVTPQLNARFEEVKANLTAWEGWRTNRINPPVLILGERGSVELGVRQLRRSVPLHTTRVAGLLVPTPAEMLRIKAFLLTERRALRDYVDTAALANRLGDQAAVGALRVLNLVYGLRTPQTWLSAFAEACEGEPVDAAAIALAEYKGLRAPFTDWPFVAGECRKLGRALLKQELDGALPAALPPDWPQGGPA